MQFAVLPSFSALNDEACLLANEGKLRILKSVEDLGDLGPGDHVLLHMSLVKLYLRQLTERCREGRLGSVRLVVETDLASWEDVGFRARPWVQSILVRGTLRLPRGTSPAPVLHFRSLKTVLADRIRPAFHLDERPSGFPSKIQIETTAWCANGCAYCPKSTLPADRSQMSWEMFRKLMDECASGTPDSIELYLNGEPLSDSRLERLADAAKAACPDSLVEIITHERSMSPGRAGCLASSGLDVVFVSVNFPDAVGVDEMRSRLLRIARFRDIFLAAGKQLVVVTLGNFLDSGESAGFDRICSELSLPVERFRATSRLGEVDLARFVRAGSSKPRAICERPFTKAYVRVTGDVILCCEDWHDRWIMGNVSKNSLADVWLGTTYRELRRNLIAGIAQHPCDRCDYAGSGK